MSHDARHINALAKGYVTNFLLHLGGDANYNLRQKKHVSRFLTDRGLDPKKVAWFVQCKINGWSCATTPQAAAYGDNVAQRPANRKTVTVFIKAEREVLQLAVGETVDDEWKKKNPMALLEYLYAIMVNLDDRDADDGRRYSIAPVCKAQVCFCG